MAITVTQEELDPCRVALEIEVPVNDTERVMKQTYRRWAKRTQVPGFRPGKAPRRLLEKEMDLDRVRGAALEEIIRDAYRQALREADVEPFADPDFDLPEDPWDGESAVSFKATISLRPKVEVGTLEGFQARRIQPAIQDEDVERELERMQMEAIRFEDTEEPAEAEDRIEVTLSIEIDGEHSEEASIDEPGWLQLGASIPEIDEALVGLKAGDEGDFSFDYPEDWPNEELRGKAAQAHAVCSGVRHRIEPQLDDEFAKANGVDTMDELRRQIREDRAADAQRLADEALDEDLVDELVKRSTIHFPQELVDRQRGTLMSNRLQLLQSQKMTLDHYLEHQQIGLPELEAQDGEQARERLTRQLALSELARAATIEVDDADVDAELERAASQAKIPVDQFRAIIEERGELERMRDRAFSTKVLAHLRSQATIEDVTE